MKDSQSATERVGRYQILDTIGAGPNGSVARAKVFGVAGFERQFAVKRFSPELTVLSAHAQALSAAARAYGSLEHPRIARMSEFGVAQGQTFTAVEYVIGLDAMRLLAETKVSGVALAIGGALALVSQAARAVGYAHGRGLTHLGLAPTNVIVTVEGDVKVTDFGILAATLPPRPVESARLANRIAYFAPEQLAGEATSAATDVFVLGSIAYELVTGQRAFRGDTPQTVAQAVLAGPPTDPPLPRPIVRVLQRCLARSPYERFPDARALADALDAALRVAPVPGTRKDIGAQVKQIVDRLGELNEGNLSGMLSLDVSTAARPPARASEPSLDSPTNPFVRPDVPVAGPAPLVGPAQIARAADSTIPEIPKPMTTVPGLAPPPIPVPPGISTGGAPPPSPTGAPTMIGVIPIKRAMVPPVIPPRPPGTGERPPVPRVEARPPAPPAPAPVPELDAELLESDGHVRTDTEPSPIVPSHHDAPTGEMSPLQLDRLNELATAPSAELQAASVDESGPAAPVEDFVAAMAANRQHTPVPMPSPVEQLFVTPPAESPLSAMPPPPEPPLAPPATTMPSMAPPPPVRMRTGPQARVQTAAIEARSRRALWLSLSVLVLGGVGAGGWYAYAKMSDHAQDAPKVVMGHGSGAGSAATKAVEAGSGSAKVEQPVPPAPADAAAVAKIESDAPAKPAVIDAGVATPAPAAPSDALQIASTPAGAHVYLDGADQGVTPVKLPGSADHHNLALLLPGHDLYVAAIEGHGQFNIELKAVTPHGGPAGIKVIKCKDRDRYYVFVDDKPTGMMCPTERIHTELGPHTVEVYDAVSESRQKWDIRITDTRLSYRVRLEQ
ncbi:MAG: protein kinase domain-containing protein [Acidobacteriota bacterium]